LKSQAQTAEENCMSDWVSEHLSHGVHAFSGGEGSTVVLVPGWPETAEAYGELFPLLAAQHSVLCVDPPGLGDSAPSAVGYNTGHQQNSGRGSAFAGER
jgi:pimeloyl-ACP methyl ester carboxylesterase